MSTTVRVPTADTGDGSHWAQLIESSPVGYAFVDSESRVKAANDALCQLFGMSKSELVGREILSLIFPDDVERVTELADRSATGLAIASWRARYVRADGSVFWGQFTIAPTFDSNGDFIGTGGSIVDVTGEVDAVTELADSERKFRMLASNTGDLVLWIRDGVILWASPASSQFGWQPGDLINQPSVSLVHPDDRYLTEVAKQTRDISVEDVRLRFRLVTNDGGCCWVEAHSTPQRGEDGIADGVVSVIRDISAQVAAEQALRDSEREFRLLAENAADIVIRFDEQGIRRWV
ncbi:MAG: PAS domain S-box protein, partial [Candidatus Nanopelagicales bacterium]